MTTLHTLFFARRAALQRQLDQAPSTREMVVRLHHGLDEIQSTFVDELSAEQAKLAIAFLETTRLATAALGTGAIPTEWHSGDAAGARRKPWAALLLLALQISVTAGLAISLVASLPTTWLPLLLLALLTGLAVLKYGVADTARPMKVSTDAPAAGEFRIDSHALLDHIANALGVIDHAVAQCQPLQAKKSAEPQLEQFADVVDFLHQIIGPALRGNAPRLLEVAEPLQQLLARHGMRIDVFEIDEAGNQAKWIAQPARDPQARDYVMLTPALVTNDGRVVRPGRVCVPAHVSVK